MSEPAAFRGIGSLIEHLRRAGFRTVGTSEAVDATRLLLALAEKEPEILSSDRLRTRLRPIFSKNREQQETFDRVFEKWARAAGDEAAAAGAGEGNTTTPEPQPQEKQNKPRDWRTWAAISLVFISVAIILIAIQSPPRPTVATGTDIAAPTTTATTATTETSGGGRDEPKPAPAPREKPKADIVGYFPRIHYNHELRPRWGWLVAALPLVPLFLFGLPAVVITRSKSRRRSDALYLDRRQLEEDARKIVPPLREDIAGKLARHLRTAPSHEARLTRRPVLDVRATIEETLRNRGIPSPRFRSTHVPPSYLLLIDVANQKDPRGRLFYQWAERLQRSRIVVEFALVRLEDGEPQYAPVSRGELVADRWLPLSRLPSPPHGQRLILISTGELLVDEHDAWRSEATAARLHRWRERVMFTPHEPRDWTRREDEIERAEHTADPGFVVMPLDENALAAWTDLLTTGQVSQVVLSEPQRFPGELRRGRGEDLLSDDTTPDPKRVERLIAQLRTYLGDLGFSWLAALAIPPFVRWELTLHIGRDVIERLAQQLGNRDVDAAIARIYRRLVRLPWLRMERMPNWLRLRLLADLSPRIQNEVRKVVENLLSTMAPTNLTDGVLLEFGAPPTTLRGSVSEQADPVYLGYMNGLTPRQLAMRAPRKWRPWLRNIHLPRERGLRGLLASAKDRATSWWARLVFLGGVPASGLRAVPMVFVALLAAAGVLFLSLVERKELTWWPQLMRSMLFEERAHTIAFHHRGPVLGAEFNSDGTRIVTAGADGVARVWDVRTGAAVSPPLRHEGAVRVAHFSGSSLLITASGTSVRLWDTRTWKQRGEPIENESPVERVEMDLRSRRLLVTGNGAVRIYGDRVLSSAVPLLSFATFSNDGQVLALFTDRTVALTSVKGVSRELGILDRSGVHGAFDRAGRRIAVSSGSEVHLFDSASGKRFASFAHPGAVLHAELNPEGTQIVTSCADGIVRLWNIGRPDAPRRAARVGNLVAATFSPDGDRILAATANGVARVWDAETGRPVGPVLRHQRGISSAVFSADGGRIVTAGADGIARVWQAFADKPELPPMQHQGDVNAVAFDPEGRRVLTASEDRAVRIWDANDSTELVRFPHSTAVYTAKWSRDGRRVFTASRDGRCSVWDSMTGRIMTSRPKCFATAMSPDGQKLAISDVSGVMQIVDVRSGATLQTFSEPVDRFVFAPDSRHILVTRIVGVRVWDSVTGRWAGPLLLHRYPTYTPLSPDSRSIFVAGNDSAQILDVATGKVRARMLRVPFLQNAIFDPSGTRIATVSMFGIQLWDARTGALIRGLNVASGGNDLSFSPDGRLLAIASPSGGTTVWDTYTGEPVSPPFHHESATTIAALSPDGAHLVTAAFSTIDAKAAERILLLPNEHRAPESSAQIWRLPPRETPGSPPGDAARHAFDAALGQYRIVHSAIVAAAALVAVLLMVWLIAMRRRMKEIERVAAPKAHEAAA